MEEIKEEFKMIEETQEEFSTIEDILIEKEFVSPSKEDIVKMNALIETDSHWDFEKQEIVLGGEDKLQDMEKIITQSMSEIALLEFLKNVTKYRKETVNGIYRLIAQREVDRTLESVYASKLWCAKHISGRTPAYTEEVCRERGVTKEQLVTVAKEQLHDSYEEHKENRGNSAKKTIDDYANYIVDVSIFWKDAKGHLILEVGRLENKIIRLAINGEMDEAKELFDRAREIHVDKTLDDLSKIVKDVILQIKKI